MNEKRIQNLLKARMLRPREKDKERISSLLKSAQINANAANKIPLEEENATIIYREIYESIRQLGDAGWWLLGFEPSNHEISLESLKFMNIKEKLKLSSLDRFRRIRNDANYRGFQVSMQQAKEIKDFWNSCSKEIIQILSKQ